MMRGQLFPWGGLFPPDGFEKAAAQTQERLRAARAQGLIAGANMTGKKRIRYEQIPYFWTEMFDLRMDFVGDFSIPPTRIELKGTHAKKRFVARYFQGDKLRALLLCQATPREVESARTELRNALGK